MKFNKIALAACVALAALPATSARAAEVLYVFSGQIDLNLGGMIFNNVTLRLTGLGDTSKSSGGAGDAVLTPLKMLTAQVTGYGTFPVPDTIEFFSNPNRSVAGFFDTVSNQRILDFSAPAFVTYDGVSPLPPTPVTFRSSNPFDTPYGQATILNAYNVTLSAMAAPEPATWTLMIAGFGVVGAAMRRRSLTLRYA